jgi:predicted membrane metal-binding protein
MWVFLIFSLILFFLNPVQTFDWLAVQTKSLSTLCLSSSPFKNQTEDVWQALVCGQSLMGTEFWGKALKSSGLIHIFVVSGSHFLVFIWILNLLRVPNWIQNFVLWIFNAMTGFTAPGTRACLSLSLQNSFNLQDHQKTLCIGFLCLGLQPDWIFSYSFWLSWLAGFMLQFCPRDPLRITQNFLFFVTWSFLGSPLSIWALFLNITLAPIIGWILFPLAMLSLLYPFDILFELLLGLLEWILKWMEMDQKKIPFNISLRGLSFVVLATHLYYQASQLIKQGRKIN